MLRTYMVCFLFHFLVILGKIALILCNLLSLFVFEWFQLPLFFALFRIVLTNWTILLSRKQYSYIDLKQHLYRIVK